ncbi:MAG: hypothetical protein AUJ20_09255 [Comamonadaceae bacterium CG1_02_60_18]|nr:MAG: hypothetical protein AUJ20_09255 [Comamonadaceae bacterium CG1_02_60_18]PIQ53052.1 MAG: hypothetical protein COW02_08185 [Comamonadaceae bacterium CG12_big_fil_rev_8_21_14_0_65_59_15]
MNGQEDHAMEWLCSLLRPGAYAGVQSRVSRWLLTIGFLGFLTVPVFGWVQYRQVQSLERLTTQSFSNFEWDAFKLELRLMSLRLALLQALTQPQAPLALAKASNEYNLFAAQVLLIDKGVSREAMNDQRVFQNVLAQSLAFLRQTDPLLEEIGASVEPRALQAIFDETGGLSVNIYHLIQQAHDLRSSRSVELIRSVGRINFYFAALSSVVVLLGAGWALFALRDIKLLTRRRQELDALYSKADFNASHDFLTGLANRRLLYEQLRHAMASSRRHGHCGALIVLDLDNFKPVNDTYGHVAGDRLLTEAARRMKQCVRDVDTVARVGGDEFVVLLAQIDGPKEQVLEVAGVIALKLLHVLAEPYPVQIAAPQANQQVVHPVCTISMGMSLFYKDSLTVDQVMLAADAAMYRAKRLGGNRVEVAD